MTRDPLDALMRLRRIAADKARRDLADCLRAESVAAEAVAMITASIEHEAEVATDLAAGDAEVEAFAAWLCRMRPQQGAAEVVVAEATAVPPKRGPPSRWRAPRCARWRRCRHITLTPRAPRRNERRNVSSMRSVGAAS